MTTRDTDLLRDTLDLLVLKALSLGPMHGWGIGERLELLSKNVLRINQGSLYPALHRLEHRGWVGAEWLHTENNRRAKYYRLTPAGRKQLVLERAGWRRMVHAVDMVLDATGGG